MSKFFPIDEKILKTSDDGAFVVVSAETYHNYCGYAARTSGCNSIETALTDAIDRGCRYDGRTSGFVALRTANMQTRNPEWFINEMELLKKIEAENQTEKMDPKLTPYLRQEGSKLWSAAIATRKQQTEEKQKNDRRLQVVCQGTHACDLDP